MLLQLWQFGQKGEQGLLIPITKVAHTQVTFVSSLVVMALPELAAVSPPQPVFPPATSPPSPSTSPCSCVPCTIPGLFLGSCA